MKGIETRWAYNRLANEVERLADEMFDVRTHGGGEAEWIAGQEKIAKAIEEAGWTQDEFDAELERRVDIVLGI